MFGDESEPATHEVVFQLLHGPLNNQGFPLDGHVVLLGRYQLVADVEDWMLVSNEIL